MLKAQAPQAEPVGLPHIHRFKADVAAMLADADAVADVDNLLGDLYQVRVTWGPKSVRREFVNTFSVRKRGMEPDAAMVQGLRQAFGRLQQRAHAWARESSEASLAA